MSTSELEKKGKRKVATAMTALESRKEGGQGSQDARHPLLEYSRNNLGGGQKEEEKEKRGGGSLSLLPKSTLVITTTLVLTRAGPMWGGERKKKDSIGWLPQNPKPAGSSRFAKSPSGGKGKERMKKTKVLGPFSLNGAGGSFFLFLALATGEIRMGSERTYLKKGEQ